MRRQAWLAALVLGVLAAAAQVQGGAVWPGGRQGRRRGRTAHTVTTEPVPGVPQMVSACLPEAAAWPQLQAVCGTCQPAVQLIRRQLTQTELMHGGEPS